MLNYCAGKPHVTLPWRLAIDQTCMYAIYRLYGFHFGIQHSSSSYYYSNGNQCKLEATRQALINIWAFFRRFKISVRNIVIGRWVLQSRESAFHRRKKRKKRKRIKEWRVVYLDFFKSAWRVPFIQFLDPADSRNTAVFQSFPLLLRRILRETTRVWWGWKIWGIKFSRIRFLFDWQCSPRIPLVRIIIKRNF